MLNVETNAINHWNICNSFGIKRMRRRFSTKNDLIPFLNVQFTKNTESTIYKKKINYLAVFKTLCFLHEKILFENNIDIKKKYLHL